MNNIAGIINMKNILILLVPTISFANNFYLKGGVLSGDNELEEI